MHSRRIVTALMRIQEAVQNLGVCRPSVSEDDRTEGGENRLIRVAMTYRLCSPPWFWTVSSVKSGRFVRSGQLGGARTARYLSVMTTRRNPLYAGYRYAAVTSLLGSRIAPVGVRAAM